MKRQVIGRSIGACLLAWGLAVPFVYAQNQSVTSVGESSAYQQTYSVPLFPGRASLIDFRNGERITFAQVSDPSYVLFQLNAPVESGQAQTIILRVSEGISFEGLTQSDLPNLVVIAQAPDRLPRTYTFNLVFRTGVPVSGEDTNGIAIVNGDTSSTAADHVIRTRHGPARINDLEMGLDVAIAEGYTQPNDPIVSRLREVFARSRNGETLVDAAESADLQLSVLVSLGELALRQNRIPILQNSPTASDTPPQSAPAIPLSEPIPAIPLSEPVINSPTFSSELAPVSVPLPSEASPVSAPDRPSSPERPDQGFSFTESSGP